MNVKVTIALLVTMLGTSACTHEVYKIDIPLEQKTLVISELEKKCRDKCEVAKCWMENESTMVCDVYMSFFSDEYKEKILSETADNLNSANLKVGFCGYDSVGTVLLKSSVRALGAGLAAAATHGGATNGNGLPYICVTSGNDQAIFVGSNDNTLAKACQTTPVEKR